jgi:hypothetical protein
VSPASRIEAPVSWYGRKLDRIRRDWRAGGLFQVAMRFLERLPVHVVSDLVFMRLDREAICPSSVPPADLAFSHADESQIEEVVDCSSEVEPARARQMTLFRKFLKEGHACAIVRERGRVIAHQWAFYGTYVVTIDGYRKTALPVALGASAVFMGNAFVRPEARGRGVIGQLKRYLFDTVPRDWSIYAWSARLNDPAVISNNAAGFRPIAILRFTGPIAWVRLSLQDPATGAWRRLGSGVGGLRVEGDRIMVAKT